MIQLKEIFLKINLIFKFTTAWVNLPGVEVISTGALLAAMFISGKDALGLNPVRVGGITTEDLDLSDEVPGRSNCNNFWELGDRGEVGVF